MLWKNVYNWIAYLFHQKETTEQNTAELKAQKGEIRDATDVLRQITFELERLQQNEAHEREKLALRLELLLMRERGTLSAISGPEPGRDELLHQIEELKRELAELRRQQGTNKLE